MPLHPRITATPGYRTVVDRKPNYDVYTVQVYHYDESWDQGDPPQAPDFVLEIPGPAFADPDFRQQLALAFATPIGHHWNRRYMPLTPKPPWYRRLLNR